MHQKLRYLAGLGRVAAVAVTLVVAISPAHHLAAQTSNCHAADSTSVRTLANFKKLVSASDSFTVRVRTRLQISSMPVNKVSYVTSAQTCAAAGTAFNTRYGTPGVAHNLYVFKLDKDYAVEDPTETGNGAYRGILIFTSAWVFKSAYAPN